MHQEESILVERAKILLDRLERLSADSTWAHRASGLRGSLIRTLQVEQIDGEASKRLLVLIEQGTEILERAAREISDFGNPPEKSN